ncbi:MAG: hypothetical protein ACFNYQ_11620, partial [Treponema sp.]|uniref:hypothetical protein n=1 Tax=Treponema sp. TaxID=166 RepID=UPI003606C74A
MEAINYAPGGQNMILTEDAQIVPGVSGNACYLPAGVGKIALEGDRNELSVSLWRQWDGIVESDTPRGIFSFKNIQIFFDNMTDLLTVVINGFKAITDIKDDQQQTHWGFTFAKNGLFTVYKNAKQVYSLSAGDKPVDMTDGFTIGGGRTHATFDEVRVYKTVLKQGEINGLFYLVSKGTQVKQLEKIVQSAAPKYLGVTQTVPPTRTVVITKGEKLGAQDANAGDWVLMAKTVGGWKVGVCYRWTGSLWTNLEPEYNYTEQYQAALYHICEIEELMKNTGHFGALFAKVLVAQKALIDELLVNQAFIKNLVVQKLHIDSDDTTHQDFEAWFDEANGLKINNKGEEIFKVDAAGNVFAKNATLDDGHFSGIITTSVFDVIKKDANIGLLFNYTANTKASKIYKENKNGTQLVEGVVDNKNIKAIEIKYEKIKTGEEHAPIGMYYYYT